MILTILFAVATLLNQAVAICPNGWVRHGSTCYHFSHDNEQFIGAKGICEDWDGYLVEINDSAEDSFLGNHAKLMNTAYMIGLTDLAEEGVWVWHASRKQASYINWVPGEPDNYHGDENCAQIRPDGFWGDVPCSMPRHYICEMPDESGSVVG